MGKTELHLQIRIELIIIPFSNSFRPKFCVLNMTIEKISYFGETRNAPLVVRGQESFSRHEEHEIVLGLELERELLDLQELSVFLRLEQLQELKFRLSLSFVLSLQGEKLTSVNGGDFLVRQIVLVAEPIIGPVPIISNTESFSFFVSEVNLVSNLLWSLFGLIVGKRS